MATRNELLASIVVASGGTVTDAENRNELLRNWLLSADSDIRCFMPLSGNLDILKGTGTATFTRATTATYVDSFDGIVRTAAIDVARFEKNGVLIEGSSTNECLRSEEFVNAVWPTDVNITVTANQATAPDGLFTADQIEYPGSIGIPASRVIDQRVVVGGGVASKTFTFSCFIRSVSGSSKFRLKNTHEGVIDNFSSDFTVGESFERVSFTVTNNASAGTGRQIVGITAASDDSAFDLYIWGAQLE